MKVAIVQNNPVFGEKQANIDELFKMMEGTQADLYILPELAYTGYQFMLPSEVAAVADEIDSPTINRFQQKAKELDAAIVFGFAEKSADGMFNSSLMVTPEGGRFVYRKTHLYYKERYFFKAGNTGFNLFTFRGFRIGLAICFDWYFPESFRTLALKGADIIAHSSNLVMPYCQRAAFTRAIENRCYIFTANRIGTESRDQEESFHFTGGSVAVSPMGEYLIEAPEQETGVFVTEVERDLSRNKNLNDLNHIFKDRKTDFYNLQ